MRKFIAAAAAAITAVALTGCAIEPTAKTVAPTPDEIFEAGLGEVIPPSEMVEFFGPAKKMALQICQTTEDLRTDGVDRETAQSMMGAALVESEAPIEVLATVVAVGMAAYCPSEGEWLLSE